MTVPATTSARARLVPGTVSPRRAVPADVLRPDYVGRLAAPPYLGSEVRDAATIEATRHAGKLAARALREVGRAVRPGTTTDELDRIGHEFLCDHGAYPSTLGYPGRGAPAFPKSLCASLNEVICHGIPDSTVIEDGDIVNIDITAYLVTDGVAAHGDTNATFCTPGTSEPVRQLVERTETATLRGIRAALPGRQLNVIGRVIETYARRFGYGVVRDFTGHGVGPAFHTGLVVPHFDAAPAHSDVIEPGMTFTVEPMLTLGSPRHVMWDDGWTAVTADGSWTAQFEHTLLITETGPELLTTCEDDE